MCVHSIVFVGLLLFAFAFAFALSIQIGLHVWNRFIFHTKSHIQMRHIFHLFLFDSFDIDCLKMLLFIYEFMFSFFFIKQTKNCAKMKELKKQQRTSKHWTVFGYDKKKQQKMKWSSVFNSNLFPWMSNVHWNKFKKHFDSRMIKKKREPNHVRGKHRTKRQKKTEPNRRCTIEKAGQMQGERGKYQQRSHFSEKNPISVWQLMY